MFFMTVTELMKKLVQDVALIKVTVKNNENRLQRIEKTITRMDRVSWTEDLKLLPKRPLSTQEELTSYEDSITDENKLLLVSI